MCENTYSQRFSIPSLLLSSSHALEQLELENENAASTALSTSKLQILDYGVQVFRQSSNLLALDSKATFINLFLKYLQAT
jgi:hypothetical protein